MNATTSTDKENALSVHPPSLIVNGDSGYFASILPGNPLPKVFGSSILALEELLKVPIWVLVHQDKCGDCGRDMEFASLLFKLSHTMPEGQPIGLLVDSTGAEREDAYQTGRLLQRRSGNNLTIIIPRNPKNAALLSLSANRLIVSRNAGLNVRTEELNVKDAQRFESIVTQLIPYLDELNVVGRIVRTTTSLTQA